MTSELKPCPFCGGEPSLYLGKGAYGVKCTCSGKAFIHTYCGGFLSIGIDREQAKANAIAAWNTRAVPDVPELVRRRLKIHGDGYTDKYVRYDQAVAVIAAKDAAIDGLSGVVEECNAEIEELSVENVALKNKLAQSEKQEAVGYAVYDKTGFRNFHTDKPNISPEELNEYEITIQPLYTSTVASDASLRAAAKDIQQVIEAAQESGRYIWPTLLSSLHDLKSALNPSEPRT